ncbi:MAG TPA: TetR/AcrR family transcriptional regulator [Gemmatimonadales bacterium]|nr:TetR/AcrR family transcriptional regulator [Gemmatimonadales bacterium]
MSAALRVFVERGYRATRLEEVAEAAGVTKGALYHYFDSKQDLLAQALAQWVAASEAEFERLVAEELHGSASVKLRTVARTTLRRWLEPERGRIMHFLAGEVAVEAPAIHRAWYAGVVARGWQVFAGLIREGQVRGEFRRDADAEAIARVFVSGFVHQFLARHSRRHDGAQGEPFDMERLLDAGLDFLLHGLRPFVVVAAPPASDPSTSDP